MTDNTPALTLDEIQSRLTAKVEELAGLRAEMDEGSQMLTLAHQERTAAIEAAREAKRARLDPVIAEEDAKIEAAREAKRERVAQVTAEEDAKIEEVTASHDQELGAARDAANKNLDAYRKSIDAAEREGLATKIMLAGLGHEAPRRKFR